jgi:hypothetical protein
MYSTLPLIKSPWNKVLKLTSKFWMHFYSHVFIEIYIKFLSWNNKSKFWMQFIVKMLGRIHLKIPINKLWQNFSKKTLSHMFKKSQGNFRYKSMSKWSCNFGWLVVRPCRLTLVCSPEYEPERPRADWNENHKKLQQIFWYLKKMSFIYRAVHNTTQRYHCGGGLSSRMMVKHLLFDFWCFK